MRSYQKVLAILAVVFFFSHNIHASTCDSISLKLMEQTWKKFRELHPFSFQTIALKHYGQDTCVFVISEPPGWVSQDSIKALFNSYGGHMGIGRHTWGYDGVLMDAIGCVKLDETKFSSFENKLFKLIYGSNYKPYYTNLNNPNPNAFILSDTLNFVVTAEDLYLIEKSPFIGYLSNDKLKERPVVLDIATWQAFQDQPSALYYSIRPEYVVWIVNPYIPATADSVFKSDARRFLLDTDLIIGAIPSSRGLAFVGRERQTPINVLPPLRAEAIQLLAQQAMDSLYTCFPADSTISLADTLYSTPVVLNESLKHSEIGNLMFQATGLLMAYANNHVYDYFAFTMKYPEAIPTNSYSSCWNSNFDGCLHSIALGEAQCMYPMLYVDEDGSILEEASNSAYDFFASQKSIDLIRLKQYAFIHEAFKMQSHITNNSQDIQINDYHEWIRVPTTIVTNAPFANASFTMQ